MVSSILEAVPEFMTVEADETGSIKYWGFARKDGKWYIARETTSDGIVSIRIAARDNNLPMADTVRLHDVWTDRANLTYSYIYQVSI